MSATERLSTKSAWLGAGLGVLSTLPLVSLLFVARALPGRPAEVLPPLFVLGLLFGAALGMVAPTVTRWRRAVLGSLSVGGFLAGVALYVAWMAFRTHGGASLGPALVLALLVATVAAPAILPPVIASALVLERTTRGDAR